MLQRYFIELIEEIDKIIHNILHMHLTERSNNILVFVPDVDEMNTIIVQIQNALCKAALSDHWKLMGVVKHGMSTSYEI